ncbi:heterokaryon incompatibility 6 OR allele [Fusarium mundagurra]|uniref:Heterokaryon incompatibility 6 OR allele n=1 Tax=Fusarium mundagurra TaxID=1567541 RepID=A0A8H5Z0X3_9HYPO|nr:heterokaryon incompatibility 6 OR allele [Fusarium mundagurra]
MAINQSFPYDKLPNPQSFRLLEIENGDSNCTISCTLRLHSLETAPLYQALSYVWGPPPTTSGKSIQCNGHDFFVTDNLYGALHRLRDIRDCCLIWIDQICINQNDLQERSQQVSIMRDIYSKAQLVNAWLGVTDSPESAHVADMISIMASDSWPGIKDSTDLVDDKTLESLGLPAQNSQTWVAFKNMLALPYFSRVWIIQEIAVAKSYRIRGSIIIPGVTFLRSAVDWLLITRVLKNRDTAHAVKNAMMVLMGIHESKDWHHLVSRFVEHEASDPHDKIYAFIGLADQTGYDIVVDYNKPVLEVYQDFTRKTIAATENLDILRFSTVQDLDTKTGPLWVPWFHSLHEQPIYFYNGISNSSKESEAKMDENTDQGTLTLRGIHVNTVAIATMPLTPSANLREEAKARIWEKHPRLSEEIILDSLGWGPITWILQAFETMMQHKDLILARNGVDLITLLLSVFTGLVDSAFYLVDFKEYLSYALIRLLVLKDKKEEIRTLLKLLHLVLQLYPSTPERQTIFDDEEDIQQLRDILAEVYGSQNEIDSSVELIKSLKVPPLMSQDDMPISFRDAMLVDRMFFITELGFVGIGPMSMKPGDHVCILYGGSTPFVVRPVDGAGDEDYLFLGESFVNGLMNGEALDDEDAIEKWFRLR